MTNLRPGASSSWMTRERVLVGLPILVGGLVVIGVAGFVLAPAMVRIDELQSEVADLQAKQQSLPNLQRQLQQAQQQQQKVLDQQNVLVDLIAGRDRIATFLALLEQEAASTDVQILRYEPLASPSPSTATNQASDGDESPPTDPLMALGYRQTAVRLEVKGGYQALQRFLQNMEALEVVVEASDLQLERPSSQSETPSSITQLALRLSFFDRPAEAPAEAEQRDAANP